jgi:hypothetical protein
MLKRGTFLIVGFEVDLGPFPWMELHGLAVQTELLSDTLTADGHLYLL